MDALFLKVILSIVAYSRFLAARFSKIFQITIIVAAFMFLTAGSMEHGVEVDIEVLRWGSYTNLSKDLPAADGSDRNHELMEDHTDFWELKYVGQMECHLILY